MGHLARWHTGSHDLPSDPGGVSSIEGSLKNAHRKGKAVATRQITRSGKSQVSESPVTAVYLCESDGTRSWIVSGYWVVYRLHHDRTYLPIAVIDWRYHELAQMTAAEFAKQYRVPLREADPITMGCE